MKTMLTVVFAGAFMSAVCVGFAACDESGEKDPNPDAKGQDMPFAEYSLTGESGEEFSARWINLNYFYHECEILIINNDDEMKKYVEGKYPPIDFSKKTLVLAYGYMSGAYAAADGHKFQQFSERNYVMTANLVATVAAAFYEWQVALVVDKLQSNSMVELKTVSIN